MNKKVLASLLFAASAAIAGNAQAVNWGATLGYSISSVEEENDRPGFEGDISYLSIGVTLDTGKPNRVFGYRGTLAYVAGEYELDGGFETDYNGLTIDNTFGFRVGGNANQRFWIGPAIDLQAVNLDSDSNYDSATAVGLGASFGVDFYQRNGTGQFFSLEGGFRVGGVTLDRDDDVLNDSRDDDLESDGLFVRGTFFFTGGPKQ